MNILFAPLSFLCISTFFINNASAQVFGGETSVQNSTPSFQAEGSHSFSKPVTKQEATSEKPVTQAPNKVAQPTKTNSPATTAPAPSEKTENTRSASSPAHLSIEEDAKDMSGIFLYYTDFSLDHRIEDEVSCSVRFVVYTTLEQKLSSIAVRLTWPNLSTKLSFVDIEPGKRYYTDYSFFGDGCYSMDKLPNVTINRCRLKGKTQQQCANLFRLTKE